jgi:carboxypeptidase family protein
MKKLALFLLFVSLATARLGAQQATGTINGSVLDAQGAAVVNAEVTVTDPSTGFERKTVSGSYGDYSLPLLPPSAYILRVQAKGFSTVEQKGIALRVGQILTLNQTLKPGAVSTVLEVTSQAPLIDLSSSQIGGSVSPTEVSSLPLSDRNFAGLQTLIPGVRQAEGFDPTKTRVGNVSINGGDGRQADTNVDNGDNKDLVVGGIVQNFTMEGIQEFGVVTSRFTAEAGHSVGGSVNVITKSGTNNLHGSAFGLAQLSTLNRTNFFESLPESQGGSCDRPDNVGRCKQKFHRWYYGGSFGGPVIKDKFFFFGAFEQKREPGSLSPAPGTVNEATTFATQTANFAGGPYAFPTNTLPFPYVDNLGTVKLDYKLGSAHNFFLRYGRQKWTNPNDQVGNLSSPFRADGTQSNTDLNNFHDLSIGYNYAISSTKVNSLTVHFQDMVNAILAAPTHTFTYPVDGGGTWPNPNIIFSDGTQVGQNVNVPQETLIRKYQLRDDFNWIHGKHNFKFGGNWIYFAKMGGFFFFGADGYQLTFFDDPVCIANNDCATGNLYPNGISTPGAVRDLAFSTGSGNTAQPPWHSLGLYWQDDYKVTRRLTLNLGIRWDANINFLRPMLGDSLTNSNRTIFWLKQTQMNDGAVSASDPGVQEINRLVGNTSNLNRTTADWKEFQPRLGFAWDVLGNGKQVIRGGYGIARDQIFQNITLFSVQQTQSTIYQTAFDHFGTPPDGTGTCQPTDSNNFNLATFCFGNPISPLPTLPTGVSVADIAPGAIGRIVDPRITDPWSQQASLGWAYQIGPDYAFSVDYYHILGTHEERVRNVNPEINGGPRLMDNAFTAAGIALENPTLTAGRFAQIYDYSTNNRSMYDGINFQLKKRMARRFMFQGSYVLSWSRSWGGFPVASYGGSGLAVPFNEQFNANEFNRTYFDERNRVVLSGVFDLPAGLQIAPIFQAASGRPYSELAGTDIDGDGRHTIDRVCVGSTVSDPITTPGCTMIKPNTLTGKPFVEMDLRASKTFKLGERARLTTLVEVYNLFNRANFCNSYEQDVNSTTFNTPRAFCSGPVNAGTPQGASSAAVQSLHTEFGLRFEF